MLPWSLPHVCLQFSRVQKFSTIHFFLPDWPTIQPSVRHEFKGFQVEGWGEIFFSLSFDLRVADLHISRFLQLITGWIFKVSHVTCSSSDLYVSQHGNDLHFWRRNMVIILTSTGCWNKKPKFNAFYSVIGMRIWQKRRIICSCMRWLQHFVQTHTCWARPSS